MATITQLVDDITGVTKDVQTVQFSLDGAEYEIDLAPAGRENLASRLQPYVEAARPIAARSTKTTGAKRKRSTEDLSAIREWARANNFPELTDRGRIPTAVRAAYEEAHGGA